MARKVSGITVEIGGDTTKLGKALGDVNKTSRSLQTELRGVNTLLKFDPKNVTLQQQKQELLTKAVENTKNKLDTLKEAQAQVNEQFKKGEISEKQYRDFQREIAATEGQLKSYEKQLSAVSKEHRTFTENMENASKKIKDVGEKAVDTGKNLSLKVTAPLAALGGVSLKTATDFESAFAGVRKTVDATEEEFAQLEQGIRDMAKEIPASATEIASVAEAAGQLGIEKDSILSFTRTIIDLGEATDLSLEQGATQFARFANIVGMSQDDFDRLGSSVVGLGNNFATTESEIVDLGMRLAAQGKQIGLTEAEIMALSATMSSLGLSAEAGGTAMSTVMKKIQVAVDGGAKSTKAFADVAGVSAKEFADAFNNDPITALDMFIKGLDKSSQEGGNLTNILGDLGIKGIRETDTLLRMAGASDLLSEAVNLSNEAWQENTALSDEAAQRYATFDSKMAVLKNTLVDLGIDIGNILMPVILDLMEKIKGALQWFNGLSDGMKKTIVVVSAIAAAVGPILVIFGKFALGISRIIDLFIKLKPVFIAVKAAIAATGLALGPFIAIIAGVIAAIVAVIAIVKNWGAISEWFKNLWAGMVDWFNNTLIPVFANIGTAIKNFVDGAVKAIKGFVDVVVSMVTSFIDKVVNVFNTIKEKVGFIFTALKEIIGNIVVGITENVFSVFGGMIEHVQILFNGFIEIMKNIFIYLYNVITAPVQLIIAFVTGGFDGMKDKAIEIFNNILGALSGIINAIKDTIVAVVTNIRDTAVSIFENTKERVVNVFTIIKDTLTQIVEKIKEVITNVFTAIKETMINIVENIKNGVRDGFENMKQWVINTFNGLKESIKNIWNAIKDFIKTTIENIKNGVVNGFTNAVNGAKNIFEGFKNTVRTIFTTIKNTIINLMKIDLKQIGSDIIKGLVNGINGAIGWVKDAVGNVGKSIVNGFKGFFGIKSPSRLMRDVIGKMIPQGIAVGVEADTDDALDAVEEMNKQIMEANDPDMLNMMNQKPTFSTQDRLREQAQSSNNGLAEKFNRMVEVFETTMENFANPNYQVVMQDGTLVGSLRPKMDEALGEEQDLKDRGM